MQEVLEIEDKRYSAEITHLAKSIFAAAQIHPENKMRCRFLYWDLEDAIEEALKETRNPKEAAISAKQHLLAIIDKKYASITDVLTEEQIKEVILQQARLKHAKLPANYENYDHDYNYDYNYDYVEYDQGTLEAAIAAFVSNQRISFNPELENPNMYAVIRHRMPGPHAGQEDYVRLRIAVRQLNLDLMEAAIRGKLHDMHLQRISNGPAKPARLDKVR